MRLSACEMSRVVIKPPPKETDILLSVAVIVWLILSRIEVEESLVGLVFVFPMADEIFYAVLLMWSPGQKIALNI